MAFKAHHVSGLKQKGIVVRSVDVVTARALNAAAVHQTLHVIVPLHAVFMSRSICKMGKRRFTQLVFFQLPVILQISANLEAHRPIVVFAFDRIVQWLPLRMTLKTYVICPNEV